jgi:crotonobetainyl-CoA:carnitine CoA-transferase CaiB-like acyl-CoA transferase
LKNKELFDRSSMEAKPLPLEGLRVIDLGWVWSGPMVAYIFADFGAEVIKVEHSERLDNTRLRGSPIINGKKVEGKSIELGPYYHNVNRNKLSIRLNLKHPKGRELFKELVKVSDVIIENFTPGALKKLRLDYESLKEAKPDLIMVSLSTAGQEGPISDMRGYAPVISSYSGLESLVGYEGEPPLGMMTFGLSDPNAATHGFFAVMVSLYHRERTGEGVYIDMSQLEASCAVLAEAMLEYQMNGRIMGPQGNRHRIQSPHGIYPCNGEDRWVAISVDSDENWKKLVEVMGNPDWAKGPTLQELNGRLARRKVIDSRLAEWTSKQDREEIVKTLQAQGVAAMTVSTVEEQYTDTYFQYRGVRQEVIHPLLGRELLTSVPWSLSETPGTIRKSAPLLGEHDTYVYETILGLSQEDIKKLEEEKVIY